MARLQHPRPVRIAKRFRWEAAHRLLWHEGDCANLHGHSYRLVVEIEGTPDERGMLLDFQVLKKLLQPLVSAFDHAIIVAGDDAELLGIVEQTSWKHFVLPFDTTTENLAGYIADYLCDNAFDLLKSRNVRSIRVKLAETETCYAETERNLVQSKVLVTSPISKSS